MVTNITDIHIVALVTLKRPKRFASGYSLLCLVANEKKVNQSRYRPEVPRGFQEVKFPRLRDNGTGWW